MNIRNRWISAGVIVSLVISGITLLTTERTTLMANASPLSADFMQRLQERIDKLDRRIDNLATFDGLQYFRAVEKLTAVIAALPQVNSATNASSGFALAAGWTTKATVSLTVPAGKSLANITAIGGAAAADGTTGGSTNAQARILINNVSSVTFEAAKDAGASVVNNILSPSFGRAFATTEGSVITVTLQLNPLNAAAFAATASNYASLTVIGTFS